MSDQDTDDDGTRPEPSAEGPVAPVPAEEPAPGEPAAPAPSLRAVVRREPGERGVRRVAVVASIVACALCVTLVAFAPTLVETITGAFGARVEEPSARADGDGATASPAPSRSRASASPTARPSARSTPTPTPSPSGQEAAAGGGGGIEEGGSSDSSGPGPGGDPGSGAGSGSGSGSDAGSGSGSGGGSGGGSGDGSGGGGSSTDPAPEETEEPAPDPAPDGRTCGGCAYTAHESGYELRPRWQVSGDVVRMGVDWRAGPGIDVTHEIWVYLVTEGGSMINPVQAQVATTAGTSGSGASGWVTVTAELMPGESYEVIASPRPTSGSYMVTFPEPTSPPFTY